MKKNTLFILAFAFSINTACAQADFVWGKQFGSERDERTRNLVVDSLNNVYVFGKTSGKVGKENFGKYDAFVVKVDSTANTVWALQIGSKEDDDFFNGTIDRSGNLYLIGYIGVGKKNPPTPDIDILVVKISSSGKIIWQRQFGTDSIDMGGDIAVGPGEDVYIIGSTQGVMGSASKGKTDCVLLHLDRDGNQLQVLQFGTPADDQGSALIQGSDSKIFICGSTEGDLAAKNAGKSDAFWGIYSKDFKKLQIRQCGKETAEIAAAIGMDDSNNVYIAGSTDWTMVPNRKLEGDCFLQKWNMNGELIWTRQFGTDNWDGINGLAVMDNSGVIVSGCTDNPQCKSFCRKYNQDGSLLWSRNFIAQGGRGTCGKGVCISRDGNIYHTGYTGANLFSELRGAHDVFLLKLRADMK